MINVRLCSVCKVKKDKSELIRILKSKDDLYIINPDNKTFGRSAYICIDSNCIERAKKMKALDRSFKHAVPKEVYDNLCAYENR